MGFRNAAIGFRWRLVFALLRIARWAAVKDCDYGNRVCDYIDTFFFYIGHGCLPNERRR